MLCREGILKIVKGKEGNLYVPQRSYAHRMLDILKELTLSEDELWKRLR